MYILSELKSKIESLKLLISEGNENNNEKIQEDFFSILNELKELSSSNIGSNYSELETLQRELEEIKESYEFYDEEGELDMMFPDRHEEDFDEDAYNIWDKD